MATVTQRQKRDGGQDKLQAALRRLEQGVEAITTSQDFRRYLSVMARFHTYSWGNVLLIAAQRPDATMVAGYKRWQQLGRQVMKGEKGLAILAPLVCKAGDEQDGSDKVVSGFRVATVFDISQTQGDPLPEPPAAEAIRSATDRGAVLFHRLEQWLRGEGLTVEIGECGSANGYYQPGTRRIVLSPGIVGTDHQAKTLCHEAAHHIAGHRGFMPADQCETVAEAAAYVVLDHFGIDTGGYSFGYVAGWAREQEVLRRNLGAIRQTAHHIIDALEAPQQGDECRSNGPEKAVEAL